MAIAIETVKFLKSGYISSLMLKILHLEDNAFI